MTIFAYPSNPHVRQHGPRGYRSYKNFKAWLRDEFAFRCAYCLMREGYFPHHGADYFGVEHVVAQAAGGPANDYNNLVYACNRCNYLKQQDPLPDPTRVAFGTLLRVNRNGWVVHSGRAGRLLVDSLDLNDDESVEFREDTLDYLNELPTRIALLAGRVDPWNYFSYPRRLPDLTRLRPPGNTQPQGVRNCHFLRRKAGTLPATY